MPVVRRTVRSAAALGELADEGGRGDEADDVAEGGTAEARGAVRERRDARDADKHVERHAQHRTVHPEGRADQHHREGLTGERNGPHGEGELRGQTGQARAADHERDVADAGARDEIGQYGGPAGYRRSVCHLVSPLADA